MKGTDKYTSVGHDSSVAKHAVGPLAQSVELCTYEVNLYMQGSRVRFSEGPLFSNAQLDNLFNEYVPVTTFLLAY